MERPVVTIPWTPEEEEYFREREERGMDTRANRRVMTTTVRRVGEDSRYRMIYYRDGMAAGGTWEPPTHYSAERILDILRASAECYVHPSYYKRSHIPFPEYKVET